MDPNVEVPSYFRCPISMELMKDPVTVSTGMTYDRESIEHWFYRCNKRTCPATMQELQNLDMIPNHTLRRLIQGWCVANGSKGVKRMPTPKPPVDSQKISDLLQQAARSTEPFHTIQALRKLRFLARENETNKRCILEAGPWPILVPLLHNFHLESGSEEIENENFRISNELLPQNSEVSERVGHQDLNIVSDFAPTYKALDSGLWLDLPLCDAMRATHQNHNRICEEALGILHLIPLSEDSARLLSEARVMRSLGLILQRGNSHARLHAAVLLQNVATQRIGWEAVVRQNAHVLDGLVEILRDEFYNKGTMAALDVLKAICSESRRNKLKAVEAGVVFELIELLPEAEGRKAQKILEILDKLVECAEGRAAMNEHAMGITAVSNKIMRVSESGTRKAVRIICLISSYSPTASFVRDMIQFGGVKKLCMLLQMDGASKTKEKAKELLKLHSKAWCNSPCYSLHCTDYISM